MASAAKKKPLEISLEGGPTGPAQWRRWEKDGGSHTRDYFNEVLTRLGYSGQFILRGVQSAQGGPKNVFRIGSIIASRNCLEVTSQLGSRASRWKYELTPPPGVDLVELSEKLQEGVDNDEIVSEPASKPESSNDNPAEEDDQAEVVVDDLPVEESEETVDSTPVSTPASSLQGDIEEVELLALEHDDAQEVIQRNRAEMQKLRDEIAEREEMLALFEAEIAPAKKIIASLRHQAAVKKRDQIRAILGHQ